MQRSHGNTYVQRLLAGRGAVQRCGGTTHPGCACATGVARGANAADEELAVVPPSRQRVQRLTDAEKQANLTSPRYAGNPRLEAAFDNNPPLRKGASGDGVRLVQEGLVADGFALPGSTKPTGELDGVFGEETFAAVQQFQTKYARDGLLEPTGMPDGVVGRKTMGKLDDLAPAGLPICPAGAGEETARDGSSFAGEERGSAGAGGGLQAPSFCAAPPKQKKPVGVKPVDPGDPNNLRNYRCESKRVLRIEIFAGMDSAQIQNEILEARLRLLEHNMDLSVTRKPISARNFPLGFDVNLPGLRDGAANDIEEVCTILGTTAADVGHSGGTLPVFYIPVLPHLGEAHGVYLASTASLCPKGSAGGLADVVIINLREPCGDRRTLLHEIGHAAGNVHIIKTFMDACGADGGDVVLHNQVKKLCNASFS